MSPALLSEQTHEKENPAGEFELSDLPSRSSQEDDNWSERNSNQSEDGQELMTSIVVVPNNNSSSPVKDNSPNSRNNTTISQTPRAVPLDYAKKFKRHVQPSGRRQSTARRNSESDRRLELTDEETEDTEEDTKRTRTARQRIESYQPERVKTLVAFLALVFSAFMNFILLAIIHDITPSTPLPDLTFMVVDQQPWAWMAGDILSAISGAIACACMVFHKFRWTLFRRAFLIGAILYLLRAVCLAVTFMPPSFANPSAICIPRANGTELNNIFNRLSDYVFTLGLTSSEGKILCGDLMFSGHTVSLTLMYFVVLQYTPPGAWILRYFMTPVCYFGLVTVVISGGHYTIDVLVAYWISSHIFWSYHQVFELPKRLTHRRTQRKFSVRAWLTENRGRKKRRNAPLTRIWWYWAAVWFESNVPDGSLPNELEWPLPWPEVLVKLTENLSQKLNQ